MKSLTPRDFHPLLSAQGWLELGNRLEADKELDEISSGLRAHPEVLELRREIFAREKKWPACVDIGLAILRGDPQRSCGWMNYSFALHELKRAELACTHLANVAEKFPGIWRIPYNLACYCAASDLCCVMLIAGRQIVTVLFPIRL